MIVVAVADDSQLVHSSSSECIVPFQSPVTFKAPLHISEMFVQFLSPLCVWRKINPGSKGLPGTQMEMTQGSKQRSCAVKEKSPVRSTPTARTSRGKVTVPTMPQTAARDMKMLTTDSLNPDE